MKFIKIDYKFSHMWKAVIIVVLIHILRPTPKNTWHN